MCNLHDVSWGNRPANTGQEALTAKKAEQEKNANQYKIFRTNFVLCWLAANTAFYIIIMQFAVGEQEDIEYKDPVDDIIDDWKSLPLYLEVFLDDLM